YFADNPGLVSHVPVGVRILDVNDNPPELAREYDVVVCENAKPGQVIQTITATDKDYSANGARFHFSLDEGLSLNPNFTLRDNEGK
ncbi:CAD18 protein, partial [Mesembrinibis cayennensis]|nr:CAD18 protein [Mesembrinibis cayennensis]